MAICITNRVVYHSQYPSTTRVDQLGKVVITVSAAHYSDRTELTTTTGFTPTGGVLRVSVSASIRRYKGKTNPRFLDAMAAEEAYSHQNEAVKVFEVPCKVTFAASTFTKKDAQMVDRLYEPAATIEKVVPTAMEVADHLMEVSEPEVTQGDASEVSAEEWASLYVPQVQTGVVSEEEKVGTTEVVVTPSVDVSAGEDSGAWQMVQEDGGCQETEVEPSVDFTLLCEAVGRITEICLKHRKQMRNADRIAQLDSDLSLLHESIK